MEVSGQLYPQLYLQGESLWYPLDRRLDGHQSLIGCSGKESRSFHCPCWELNPNHPAQSYSPYWLLFPTIAMFILSLPVAITISFTLGHSQLLMVFYISIWTLWCWISRQQFHPEVDNFYHFDTAIPRRLHWSNRTAKYAESHILQATNYSLNINFILNWKPKMKQGVAVRIN